eukprot:1198347-Rhodomonas_salina.3
MEARLTEKGAGQREAEQGRAALVENAELRSAGAAREVRSTAFACGPRTCNPGTVCTGNVFDLARSEDAGDQMLSSAVPVQLVPAMQRLRLISREGD